MRNMSFNQGVKDKDGILIEDKISNEFLPKGFRYLFIKSVFFTNKDMNNSSFQIQVNGIIVKPVNIQKSGSFYELVFYDRFVEFNNGYIEFKAISPFPFEFELACEYRNDKKN